MTTVHSEDLEVLERLGGSAAVVHRAVVRTTGRVVVVKRAPWDRPDVADRLGREAEILARLDHPGLVGLLARRDDTDARRLVLAHAPGGSLDHRLTTGGPLPATEVADLGASLADVLAALHGHGVVHRDVHPGNVLFDAELRPLLTDLDHALDAHGPPLPTDDEVVGHPDHVDARLFAGDPPGPTADLHALGTTLWAAATGTPPPRPDPQTPPRLEPHPRVPAPLHDVIAACVTGRVPDAATAAAMCREVAAELRQAPPPAPSPAPVSSGPTGDGQPVAVPGPGVGSLAALPPPAPRRPVLVPGSSVHTRSWGPAPGQAGTAAPAAPGRRRTLVVAAVVVPVLALGGWAVASRSGDARTTPDVVAAPDDGHAEADQSGAVPVAAPPPCEARGDEGPVVLADLDGDGCSEAITLEDGVLTTPDGRYALGRPGDVLLAGDWDGDGRWGVGLYRPTTGAVFLFDGPPGPGARSRPATTHAVDGTPVVVATPEGHRVEVTTD